MEKIIIYHNNRCSKSRECLVLLQENKQNIKIIDYINNPLNGKQIQELLQMLKIPAKDLIRTNESIWKEVKTENSTEAELISLMAKYPKLIQRPIVVKGQKAMIIRPAEKLFEFLSDLKS